MPALPRAILFDLDDTILSFADRRLVLISIAEEFSEHLGPLTAIEVGNAVEEAFVEFWASQEKYRTWRFDLLGARVMVAEQAFARLVSFSPALTPEVAKRFAERFHAIRDDQISFFPGALEALDTFRAHGVRMALVTNGHAQIQRAKVERFDLASRFDHVQIEGEVGFGKPQERAYLHAMEALGVTAADTWMVGDNLEWEVAAPQRVGIYAIWHDHAGTGVPPNSLVKPDRIVRSIAELLE